MTGKAPTLQEWLDTPIGEQTYGQCLYGRGYRIAAKVGKVSVVVDPSKPYGFGEHDESGELGGLWFEATGELRDYDGVFDLSLDYAAAIEALGYSLCEYATDDDLAAQAKAMGGYVPLARSKGREVTTATLSA